MIELRQVIALAMTTATEDEADELCLRLTTFLTGEGYEIAQTETNDSNPGVGARCLTLRTQEK